MTVLFIRVFKPSWKGLCRWGKKPRFVRRPWQIEPKEKKMALWLSLMIAFWLLYPFMGIGIAWGTMLLASLMLLPSNRST